MVSFRACRRKAEMVAPARSTPRETLPLSDIDDYSGWRYYLARVEFFRRRAVDGPATTEPARAVRAAIAEALVYYYPFAGRLREKVAGAKLEVECTGEGVVLVEAYADVRLEDLGEPLLPPFPCVEELLCDGVGDAGVVVDKPLFFLQVTQLKCTSFVLGYHICHPMADGYGICQFITAITNLAGGAAAPPVLPVWERELLMARAPPRITRISPAYESFLRLSSSTTAADAVSSSLLSTTPLESMENMEVRSFVLGPRETTALRSHLPAPMRPSATTTTFELLTCVMWRCRTITMGYGPGQRVYLSFTLTGRGRLKQIPRGFYGNAQFPTLVEADVDELRGSPLADTVRLMQRAKRGMTEEHLRSMVDMAAMLRGRPGPATAGVLYQVSDITRVGVKSFDFGWAERVGGGPAMHRWTSYLMGCKNADGEESVAVSMLLPRPAMERFAQEIGALLSTNGEKKKVIPSSL